MDTKEKQTRTHIPPEVTRVVNAATGEVKYAIKCTTCTPHCHPDNSNMVVDVTMLMPSNLENKLSAKALATKAVRVYAVNWGRAHHFCNDCGRKL